VVVERGKVAGWTRGMDVDLEEGARGKRKCEDARRARNKVRLGMKDVDMEERGRRTW